MDLEVTTDQFAVVPTCLKARDAGTRKAVVGSVQHSRLRQWWHLSFPSVEIGPVAIYGMLHFWCKASGLMERRT